MLDCNSPKFFREIAGGHYDIRFFRGTLDADARRSRLIALLNDFVRLCAQFDTSPVLMHGALIGWFWNKKLLPWDTDIDVCLRYEDLEFLHENLGKVERSYDRSRYLFEVNPFFKDRETLNSLANRNSEPNKIDARFVDLDSGLFVDITALAALGDTWVATKCPHFYRVEDLFPLQVSNFEGISVNIPANVPAVLEQEYGANVLTLDHFHRHRFDAQTREWLPDDKYAGNAKSVANNAPASSIKSAIAGHYIYHRVGFDFRTLELLEDGTICAGAAARERFWRISEDGSSMDILGEEGALTCTLSNEAERTWKGHWLIGEQMPIELTGSPTEDLVRSYKPDGNQPDSSGRAFFVREYHAKFVSDSSTLFREIRNSSVLIVWPHGFGDWVFLGHILPLLDPSNRYFVTRLGDDTVSLFECCELATPLYCGISLSSREARQLLPHVFGQRFQDGHGSERNFVLPASLAEQCERHQIEYIYAAEFPETTGSIQFPFHSKARSALRLMTNEQELPNERLDKPLANSIRFASPDWIARWVESRLSTLGGNRRKKLCLISRTGFSCPEKNWGNRGRVLSAADPLSRLGDPTEARNFMRLLKRCDPNWLFLSFEDRIFPEEYSLSDPSLSAFSFAELFGEKAPFGLVVNHLVGLASLSVGVPTGPFHLSMLRHDLPTIGIHEIQFPNWYDEPKQSALHVVSGALLSSPAAGRPGSFLSQGNLNFRHLKTEDDHVKGQDVFNAAELLGILK